MKVYHTSWWCVVHVINNNEIYRQNKFVKNIKVDVDETIMMCFLIPKRMFLLVKYIVIAVTIYFTSITIYVSELKWYVMKAQIMLFSAYIYCFWLNKYSVIFVSIWIPANYKSVEKSLFFWPTDELVKNIAFWSPLFITFS